ncbi:MAG: hypothetical protein CVU71_08020 [Deltaproteobacteria bacterium HGW-Deltaproteobacteria-6]|jgi:hypothetical protein|nr:MAG: hypothetical protein CVU71_08020 [Deltaproteobacteria bacterium HGW-Deltaproteobacteria-6]
MKKIALILLSVVAGLLLGRYDSLVPKKLLLDYLLAACMTFGLSKLTNNNVGNLITVQEIFQ